MSLIPQSAPAPVSAENSRRAIRALLGNSAPITWLFTGDSVTQGGFHTMGWRSYPELFHERVRHELEPARVQDVVINTGVNGDNTGGLLKNLAGRIFRFEPQVVSIMMGLNDCGNGPAGREAFRSNLNRLIDSITEHRAIPILHTPNATPSFSSLKDLVNYVDIIRDVTRDRRVILVDHYAHWLEANKTGRGLTYWLSGGGGHPNEYGHREFAKLTFKELGMYDPASYTCRLFVP